MALAKVFELCRPREGVLSGAIADSDHAANLSNVLSGRATKDYAHGPTFLAHTYPTEGLKEVPANARGRPSGNRASESAVFKLDSSFSAGKTHGLIALVHARPMSTEES